MSISFDLKAAQTTANDLRSAAAPVQSAGDRLVETSNAITGMVDSEALKKDGYHNIARKAAEFCQDMYDQAIEVADAIEGLSATVEHYEDEVINLLGGAPKTEELETPAWNA